LSNKNKIVETLGNYKITIDKIKATIGPTVTLYEITLTCTLSSPTTMTGTYYVKDLTKLLSDDYGNFNLTLTAPVI